MPNDDEETALEMPSLDELQDWQADAEQRGDEAPASEAPSSDAEPPAIEQTVVIDDSAPVEATVAILPESAESVEHTELFAGETVARLDERGRPMKAPRWVDPPAPAAGGSGPPASPIGKDGGSLPLIAAGVAVAVLALFVVGFAFYVVTR